MSPRAGTEPSRGHLISAAIECFATSGFQGTTMERIARAAGVTKGAIYYHFKDKQELLFATVRNRIAEFESRVLEQAAPDDQPLTTLRRVVDACFLTATESNHRRFIITLMIEALDTNPELSEVFRRELHRMRGFLADVVHRGQSARVLRTDVEPRAVAALMVATIMGAEIQHYQDPSEIDLRHVLDGELVRISEWLTTPPGGSVERGERVW